MAATTPPSSPDSAFYKPADTFFCDHAGLGLTYDDVTLATLYSEILPRDANLETTLTEGLHLRIPIISADMDTVTEAPMAIAMALAGGLGLIHCNLPEREQLSQVSRVKNNIHGLIQEPIKIAPDQLIGDVLVLVEQKGFSFRTFPVVDEKGTLLGLLPGHTVRPRYAAIKVADAMTPHEREHMGHLPAGRAGWVLVEEVAAPPQLQLINLKGALEQHIALAHRLPDALGVQAPIIETPVEAAEGRTRWTANHNVRLFLLD